MHLHDINLIKIHHISDERVNSFHKHINTFYAGIITRILDSRSHLPGSVANAHWTDHRGIFVTSLEEEVTTFINVSDKNFVC